MSLCYLLLSLRVGIRWWSGVGRWGLLSRVAWLLGRWGLLRRVAWLLGWRVCLLLFWRYWWVGLLLFLWVSLR